MTTLTIVKPIDDIVKSMRQIREDLSDEIKDMTFAEERDFLDELLKKTSDGTNLEQGNSKSTPIK